ncbi:uncharacterized protein TNCV_12561 [Trichonephila clavipes]|nr:uncharacterized protein TNCV_12561 [Trichonephila clavipes]
MLGSPRTSGMKTTKTHPQCTCDKAIYNPPDGEQVTSSELGSDVAAYCHQAPIKEDVCRSVIRAIESIENKVLLYTAVMRPILAYASPVWGYAAKTNINILDTLKNSLIRMIVKATRYMRNDDIRNALKINSFKTHIQNLAINFFTDLHATNNVNMQNLNPYTPNDNTKRPRRILLDSYNPP